MDPITVDDLKSAILELAVQNTRLSILLAHRDQEIQVLRAQVHSADTPAEPGTAEGTGGSEGTTA